MLRFVLFIFLMLNSYTNIFGQELLEFNLTNNTADDRYASYSPDGDQIIFESNRSGNWQLYLMDTLGDKVKQLTFGHTENRRPTWHPNGKRILFESIDSAQINLLSLNLAKQSVSKLDIHGYEGSLGFASYSPDGQYIAVTVTESSQKSNIGIVNSKGGKLTLLTNNEYRSFYPRWHPNGKTIVFSSRHDTDNQDDEIYTIDLKNNALKRLSHWPKHNFCPMFSNDGKQIAYACSMENSRPEIYIMDAAGNDLKRITYNDSGETLPNWSQKNDRLLLTAYREGNYEICEIHLGNTTKN